MTSSENDAATGGDGGGAKWLNQRSERILMAIIVGLAFLALGWIFPMVVHTATPAENYVEITDSDLTVVDNTTHQLNLTYQSSGHRPVEATIVLYPEGEEVSVASWETSGFIDEGSHQSQLTLERESTLEPGTYYYAIEIRVHLDYDVEKKYQWESPRFAVTNETAANSTETIQA